MSSEVKKYEYGSSPNKRPQFDKNLWVSYREVQSKFSIFFQNAMECECQAQGSVNLKSLFRGSCWAQDVNERQDVLKKREKLNVFHVAFFFYFKDRKKEFLP